MPYERNCVDYPFYRSGQPNSITRGEEAWIIPESAVPVAGQAFDASCFLWDSVEV